MRDLLLRETEPGDIDIATDATPQTITGLFRQVIGVGEQFGVMVVVLDGMPFEVATFRSDTGATDGRHPDAVVFTDAATDARRRDFTINGMFYDPFDGTILDYVGGRADLEARLVRAIGEPRERFAEDYLRLLRAIRFASRLGFTIDDATWNALTGCADGIAKVSAERIFLELDKMLTDPHPDRAVNLLHRSGLLKRVLPEVSALDGVNQPPQFHPEGDVLTHTVLALSHLTAPSSRLAWSALLHDIGKPATLEVSDRIRFNNHHRAGALMSERVFKRLRAPGQLAEEVFACIDNHMNFMNVEKMRLSTLKRFLARPTIRDEIELHRVDCLASHGDLGNVVFLNGKLEELAVEQIRPQPLISGRHLIALGLKPGPLFGRILRRVYDLQLEETLATADQAAAWVQSHLQELLATTDAP